MKKKALPKRGLGKKTRNAAAPVADLETLVQSLPPVPVGGAPGTDWIHEECKFLYVMTHSAVTLKELAEHPRFRGHISVRSLAEWSHKEAWVELRRQNAESWRRKITEDTGRELIEARREFLTKLRTVAEVMFKQLLPDKKGNPKLEVQSYESMAQAFVKAITLVNTMTQDTLDNEMPELRPVVPVESGASEKSEVALKPTMTDEEARIGSRAILEARLIEQRKLAAAHAAKKGQ